VSIFFPTTFPASTLGSPNTLTIEPIPSAYYPTITQDITASSYTLIFNVTSYGETPVKFYVKNLDPTNNILVQSLNGETVSDAVFFGTATYLVTAGATNGLMCACEWDGTGLTVY
jgi:hypothetical protein